jgi:hypothetical protein
LNEVPPSKPLPGKLKPKWLLWHQTILEQHGALQIGFNDAGYVRKLFVQFFGFDTVPVFFMFF